MQWNDLTGASHFLWSLTACLPVYIIPKPRRDLFSWRWEERWVWSSFFPFLPSSVRLRAQTMEETILRTMPTMKVISQSLWLWRLILLIFILMKWNFGRALENEILSLKNVDYGRSLTSFVQIINITLNFIKDLVRYLHDTANNHQLLYYNTIFSVRRCKCAIL